MAAIVEGCSDADVLPKPPWQARKEQYLAHLEEASPEILRVSVADKLHNVRAILLDYRKQGDELWERFTGDQSQTLWYYRQLVSVYQRRVSSESTLWCQVSEIDRVLGELETLVGSA